MIRSGPGSAGKERNEHAVAPKGAATTPRAGAPGSQRNDLSQMLDGAVHDLRTPLGAMSGWLEVIETELGEVDGVLGKAVAGLRRAVDEQERMILAFSHAFGILHESVDPQRRCGFIDRLLVAAGRLDADARARLGSLEHLRGRSKAQCIDGGNALDDGLLVFLRLLAMATDLADGSGFTIDGEDEGLVVHLRSRPACVDSLLAFCNGLDRGAVKRVNVSLPTLWAARLALMDSGLEPGARVARRGSSGSAANSAAASGSGSTAWPAGGKGPAGDGSGAEVAPVDMVIWLRIVDEQAGRPRDDAATGDPLGDPPGDDALLFAEGQRHAGTSIPSSADGRSSPPPSLSPAPSPRSPADGLAAVGALAAADIDASVQRIDPHALSLDAILAPRMDSIGIEAAGLGGDSRGVGAGRLPPIAVTPLSAADEAIEAGMRTILIVDDQKDIREMLALWLRCHQFQVVVAGSAREARQRLAESGEIQAALIDIRMPEEDGISLLRSIRDRESERGERRMPALAITAQPSFETQSSALQAGFSGLLSKPLRLRQLIELVENLH